MELSTQNKTNSEHLFAYRAVEKKRLVLSLTITLFVMILEIIGGLLINSIALISDAGHMFTHCFSIGISLFAIILAKKPPCHHKTFGLYRAEVLAAFINGLFLLPIAGLMVYEAILRILYPQEVLGFYMLIVALIGLAVNMTSILLLQGIRKSDLNVKSVVSHMLADTMSSMGIVVISIIIFLTGWSILDPLVSIGISMIIIYWSFGILKESTRILLEMAPKGIDIDMISRELKSTFKEIVELNDAHLWTITPDILLFSAHIRVSDNYSEIRNQDTFAARINDFLLKNYYIIESTIQLTTSSESGACKIA